MARFGKKADLDVQNSTIITLKANCDMGDIDVDGDFGVLTYSAVNKFQNANGLERDGIVGPKTWEKLKE